MEAMYFQPNQNMWQGMGQMPNGQMFAQMPPGMFPGFGAAAPVLQDGCDDPLLPEQAIQIYALRSRATSGNSPMELAAAGRSAVVAEMFKITSKTVKSIWTRKSWIDVTSPYWTEHETLMYECEKAKSAATPESATTTTQPNTPLSRDSSFSSNASFSASFSGRSAVVERKQHHNGSFKGRMGSGSFKGRRRHSTESIHKNDASSPVSCSATSDHGGSKRNLLELLSFEEQQNAEYPEQRASKRRASIAESAEMSQTELNAGLEPPRPPVNQPVNACDIPNAAHGVVGLTVSNAEVTMRTPSLVERTASGAIVVAPARTESRHLLPKLDSSHRDEAEADAGREPPSIEPVPSVVSSEAGSHPGELRTFSSASNAFEHLSSDSSFFRTISTAFKRTASHMWDNVSRTTSISSIWNRTLSTASRGMGPEEPQAGGGFPLNLNDGGSVGNDMTMSERVDMLLEETMSKASVSDEEFEPGRNHDDDFDDDDFDDDRHRRR